MKPYHHETKNVSEDQPANESLKSTQISHSDVLIKHSDLSHHQRRSLHWWMKLNKIDIFNKYLCHLTTVTEQNCFNCYNCNVTKLCFHPLLFDFIIFTHKPK